MMPLHAITGLLSSKSPYRQPAIVGLTLILLMVSGLTILTAGEPSAAGLSDDIEVPGNPAVAANSETRTQARCPECGVIVSLREIAPAEKPAMLARYEITVRMRGGTNRTFVDTNPDNWRPGERVNFIEDTRQASN